MLQIAGFLLTNSQAVHMEVEKGVIKTTEKRDRAGMLSPGTRLPGESDETSIFLVLPE